MVCFCKIDLASRIFVLWGTVHIIRFVGLQLDDARHAQGLQEQKTS